MKKIKRLVNCIDEELKGAKDYAEKYVEAKAYNQMDRATKYKEMANDELKHANYIHAFAVEDIEKLKAVYTPPVDMEEVWDKSHKEYIERTAWVKQMLTM